jgi:hypothetical protein
MAVALAATVEPDRLSVRLETTGIPAGADTYTITRTAPSGNEAGVRGATGAPVTGVTMIARDWEAPFDLELVYTVTVYDGVTVVGTATVTVTVPWAQCPAWLVDLARPTNSLAAVIESMRELNFDAPAGVHRVLERRAPVMTTLPAYTPTTELIVLADTLSERDRLRNLFGSGYPFLLRTDPAEGIGNMYLGLTQFVEERILTDGYAPQRRFRVACVQVERPDPAVFVPTAPNTYQNVKDTFATYADLLAAVGTYDQLAYTFPDDPDAESALVPWLPDDI